MKKRKLVLAFAAGLMTCAISIIPGFADEAQENHFRAYAGESGKTEDTIYYSNGCVWARVEVEGDDLSDVSYVWKAYYDQENYENGWDEILAIEGPVLIDNNYSDGKIYICEVSDGYGNTREVRFDTEPYQFPGVSPANFTIPVGESFDLLQDLQDYCLAGEALTDWGAESWNTPVLEVSNDTVLQPVKPGFAPLFIWTPTYEEGWGAFGGVFGAQVQFKDATDESAFWYAPVYWGVEREITEGYADGTFRPANDCTRSQMVTFLWRLAGSPEPVSDISPFKDATDPDTYFYKAMLWGAENGIVNGYTLKDGTQEFRPAGKCTRQQAVTFMWRYAGEPEPTTAVSNFTDIQDESTYFYKAVLWAAENGITDGYADHTFKPTGNCLRRQMITFLYRFDQDMNSVKINEETFPDAVFRDYVSTNIDRNHNGKLEQTEIEYTDEINVSGLGIESLQGIEYFSNLGYLICTYNYLTSLDVSRNTELYDLMCGYNQLSELDITHNSGLGTLDVSGNELTVLDISQNPNLVYLYCNNNQLETLDVSDNPKLRSIGANGNDLSVLDISENSDLAELYVRGNHLTELDLRQAYYLTYLDCGINQLSTLDLSNNEYLYDLKIFGNPIASLDLSSNTSLAYLCIDVDQTVTGTDITPIVLMASDDESRIPDAAFRAFLSGFDFDGDGYFIPEDVSTIDVAGTGVESLEGIGWFGNLTYLCCNYNSLTSLDLSGTPDLEILICDNNYLTELDLSQNPALEDVTVGKGVIITGARDGLVIRYIEENHQFIPATVIGDWWTDPYTKPANDVEAARKEFLDEHLKEYDCKVVRKAVASWGEFNDGILEQDILSGDYHADIYVMEQAFAARHMEAGQLYDLSTLDSLDLSDEKWNQKSIELMTRGDHVYGLSFGASEPGIGVFFNKRLLQEAGYDEDYLYDLQASGEWTWDKYEEVCRACTVDKDGDGILDVYGTASFVPEFFQAVLASDGADPFSVDADGHYVNNIGSDKWISAMDWGVDMLGKYEMPQPEGSQWDWFRDAFIDGCVAMTVASDLQTGRWSSMGDDWGFVMFPCGPHMDHCVQVANDYLFVIPASFTKEQAERAAYALDKYADPTPGYTELETLLVPRYGDFREERAVDETLAEMSRPENQVVNYGIILEPELNLSLSQMYYDAAFFGRTPAEIAEEYMTEVDAGIIQLNSEF